MAAAPVGFGFVDRDSRDPRSRAAGGKRPRPRFRSSETCGCCPTTARYGVAREQQLGQLLCEVIPGRWSVMGPLYERVLETGEAIVNRETSGEILSDPGRLHTALTSLYPVRAEQQIIGVGVVVVDITERKAAELALKQIAERDPQTGIYNRAKLRSELQRVVEDPAHDRDLGALLLLDIDNFSTINQSHGHPAGDELLTAIAETLAETFPAPALVARVGGDEFAVILPQATAQQAFTPATRTISSAC